MEATMFYLVRVQDPDGEWVFVTESYQPCEFVSKQDAENAANLIANAVFTGSCLVTKNGEQFSNDDNFFEFLENWDYPLVTPFNVQVVTCNVG
jgi:hypothetical protein